MFKNIFISAKNYKYLNLGTLKKVFWTVIIALVLIVIAFPSFSFLILNEVISLLITIKVYGHQWDLSYDYNDYVTESGDLIDEFDLEYGQ